MFQKRVAIISAEAEGTTKEMCQSILRCTQELPILKIAFFGLPADNKTYLADYHTLHTCVEEYFPQSTPLVSYIAQQPFEASLVAEVTMLAEDNVAVKHTPRYIVLEKEEKSELITEGIIPQDITLSTFRQAVDIFATISDILEQTGFAISDIYRQWNYIEGITDEELGSQNYQEFNDARSTFYNREEWKNGYPAATGIGTGRGGVMIELYAAKGKCNTNLPIDNPLQISAHSYSQNVLAGDEEYKTTPKFERARISGDTIYISGTAAIRGEQSLNCNDTLSQAVATMEIMNFLVSPKNIMAECTDTKYDLLRIYVKRHEDIASIKQYMQQHYPAPQKQYLVSDICRPELLIEIEGIAHIIK